MNVLRGITVLPAAIIGSWLGYMLIKWIYIWSARYYIEPDSFTALYLPFVAEWISHMILGASAVYIAAWIAPSQKLSTALVLTGVSLVFLGVCIFASTIFLNS